MHRSERTKLKQYTTSNDFTESMTQNFLLIVEKTFGRKETKLLLSKKDSSHCQGTTTGPSVGMRASGVGPCGWLTKIKWFAGRILLWRLGRLQKKGFEDGFY